MANCTTSTTTQSSRAASAASAAAALAAMLAFNVCPAQAFQSTSFLVPAPTATHHHAASFSSPTAPTTTTMRHMSPWDLECRGGNNMEQFRRGRRLQRRRNRFTPTIFDPSGGFFHQDPQLQQVGDPEVKETDDTYQLTFDLPTEVDRDGLDVSVSGRLLTVKARVTREDASADTRGGWVRRSSRTDSVSRSFVLPEGKGISSSGATASLTEDGKAEVNFFKTSADGAAAAAPAAAAATTADSSPAAKASPAPTAAANTESKTDQAGVTVGGKEKSPPSSFSSSAEYLSSLSGADPPAAHPAMKNTPATEDAAATKNAKVGETPAAGPTSPAGRAASRPTRGASVFDSLDEEFGEFAKALWGEDMAMRFPTQEEVEERNKAVREARAKRVLAIRRATMATNVSQKEEDGSYIIRVALPEDSTRDGIKLTVTPQNTLRVSYSAEGKRSLSKDVRLPKDADLSQISAKFEAEHEERGGGESGTSSVAVGAVSGLEVAVQRAAVPEPKRVNIE